MQKGLLVVLIAAGIVAVVAGAIAITTQSFTGQNNNNSSPAITTDKGTGRSLTIDLNENLGLKSNT